MTKCIICGGTIHWWQQSFWHELWSKFSDTPRILEEGWAHSGCREPWKGILY